jgi:UDP-N-acetylglucosamine 2-epimerase (non-hydrolysing)
MKKIRTLTVMGTRPEAIKMVPVIQELRRHRLTETIVVSTAQHRQMLDQVFSLFGLVPDVDLNIMQPRQSLNDIVCRATEGLDRVCQEYSPDAVLVQGDTTTAFTASLAAFNRKIPVGHVEAGLRSGQIWNPYPEEGNRRLISAVASMHFAPTKKSAHNLRRENVAPSSIYVTGNTGIDCLLRIAEARTGNLSHFLPEGFHVNGRRMILVTAHRRENWAGPLEHLCDAVRELAFEFPDAWFLYPVHLNPAVRETVMPRLSGLHNVALTEPLPYGAFVEAMAASHLILTDSGGVQEEAPSLGKPVLVLRETTERPEGVASGAAMLVGMETHKILQATRRLLNDEFAYQQMAGYRNPYGDGQAARRTVEGLVHWLGLGPCPQMFEEESPYHLEIARTETIVKTREMHAGL